MITTICAVVFAVASSSGHAMLEPLPEWFKPLQWGTDVEQIRTAFGESVVQYNESPGTHGEVSRAWIVVDGLRSPVLGASMLTIEQEPPGATKVVRIETSDDRPECSGGGEDVTSAHGSPCRWGDLRALRRVLNALKGEITARFGPPARASDHRSEAKYDWKRRGYVLSLVLDQVESGEWSVAIVAVRNP